MTHPSPETKGLSSRGSAGTSGKIGREFALFLPFPFSTFVCNEEVWYCCASFSFLRYFCLGASVYFTQNCLNIPATSTFAATFCTVLSSSWTSSLFRCSSHSEISFFKTKITCPSKYYESAQNPLKREIFVELSITNAEKKAAALAFCQWMGFSEPESLFQIRMRIRIFVLNPNPHSESFLKVN